MGVMGLVFALFTIGYILGVWTACLVLRQPQRQHEEGDSEAVSGTRVVLIGRAARPRNAHMTKSHRSASAASTRGGSAAAGGRGSGGPPRDPPPPKGARFVPARADPVPPGR